MEPGIILVTNWDGEFVCFVKPGQYGSGAPRQGFERSSAQRTIREESLVIPDLVIHELTT